MSQLKLLDQLRDALRIRHYSPRTEKAYVRWVVRFVRFHRLRHPAELGAEEIQEFLAYLAIRRRVGASTQNQALSALVFMYRHVLGREVPDLELVRAKRTRRLPVVLTREEVRSVLELLEGPPVLVAGLLYGAGLRLLEGLRLRVKDLDFGRNEVTVREGKGGKDRITVLPVAVREPLRLHLRGVRLLHETDLLAGYGAVRLPDALAIKYPSAARAWGWQYVFPAPMRYRDRTSGSVYRHHLHESMVQRAVDVRYSAPASRSRRPRRSIGEAGRRGHPAVDSGGAWTRSLVAVQNLIQNDLLILEPHPHALSALPRVSIGAPHPSHAREARRGAPPRRRLPL